MCLGCGRVVGGEQGWGCTCPPPTIRPSGPVSRSPYRDLPEAAPCPRCGGRLGEVDLHDVSALECAGCQGFFIDRDTLLLLGDSERGKALRMAFPKRPRAEEPREIHYLPCPTCKNRMNRVNFGRMSGVIVDVCKPHGAWFDAGEVNAIVDFVESGALERSRLREKEEHDRENEALRQAFKREHVASERARIRSSAEVGAYYFTEGWFLELLR